MVASAKLHKAQTAIAGKLPYEQKLHHILAGMLQDNDLQKALHDQLGFGNPHGHSPVVLQDVDLHQLPSKENVHRVAILAISSNSSMCGAFNMNIIKKFDQTIEVLEQSGYSWDDIDIYSVGRKITEHIKRKDLKSWQTCPRFPENLTMNHHPHLLIPSWTASLLEKCRRLFLFTAILPPPPHSL